jgi:hypothetical protein
VAKCTFVAYPIVQYSNRLSREAALGSSRLIANPTAARVVRQSKVVGMTISVGNADLGVDRKGYIKVDSPAGSAAATVFDNARETDEAAAGP